MLTGSVVLGGILRSAERNRIVMLIAMSSLVRHTRKPVGPVDAYLVGNHLTTPEDAYEYSLGQPVKHTAGFEVQLKERPLDFHGVTERNAVDRTDPSERTICADLYVTRQNDSHSQPSHVKALGMAFNIYF